MSTFQIFTADQIASIRRGGAILRACLELVASRVRAGTTTKALDDAAEEFICSHPGAKPAFKGYRGYPATLCTSVNEQCVHGIPGPRVLRDGDIVSLDSGVIFDGLYTDACITVPVGQVSPDVLNFLDVTQQALDDACAIVRAVIRVGDISSTIQKTVEDAGYNCVHGLTGHGLGNSLHQFPDIPNTGRRGTGPVLPPMTLIAIEPITAMGRGDMLQEDDGWTIRTQDRSISGHFEHTLLVTEQGCEVMA